MKIPFFRLFPAFPLVAAIFVFTGCGGGGGGGGGIAGGGIGGTGIGTVTGFGSVIINDIREFEIDADTEIFRDGDPITQAELEQPANEGMVAQVDVGDDVSDDFTSGTAVTINIDNLVKGPVTSVSPLQVLQQTVVVNADTSLLNMGGNVANLVIGNIVEVSGFADSNNVIQATRIERKAGGILVWKLTGPVDFVVPASFQIGNQTVELNGVVPDDCGGGLQDGDLVEVKATPIAGFTAGDPLDTVTDVECEVPGLDIPAGATGVIEAEVEGLVTAVTTLSDFRVNGQRVITTAATTFEGGAAQDIVLGAKLEAEGTLNTATGILTAEEIEFRETRIRIEAPVQPGDVDTDADMLTIMTIPVIANSLTKDEDRIFIDGLPGTWQVEINGFVDGAGEVIATEVKVTSMTPDFSDVRLRGPAETLVPNDSFDIAGVTVDVTTAVSIKDERIEPAADLTPALFFDAISSGTPVQVEKGTYNPVTETITSGEIEIED